MRRHRIFAEKTAALTLTAAMLFQPTALAAPADELNELLDRQFQAGEESLMGQTLGLSLLNDAAKEKGKSFTWSISDLSLNADGETMGVNGEITLGAGPGEITAPKEQRVLFDLSTGELLSLLGELVTNAETWEARFEPESETESGYEEETGEGNPYQTTMIGGADGPTSLFIAGKTD